MPNSLVFPEPPHPFSWAVIDQKMSQSGSKFKKCELTLNANRLLVKKFGIPTPKAGEIHKMVKSLVNIGMLAPGTHWGCEEVKNLMGHL